MAAKYKVAILCNFPVWLVTSKYPLSLGHYAVWLTSLFKSFQNCSELEIHWITLSKQIKRSLIFKTNNQTFHVLPRGKKTVGQWLRFFLERYKIQRELRKIRPDLIHAWGTEDCYGLCGSDFKGKKLFSVQGILTACWNRAEISRFEQRQAKYEPLVYKRYPFITTESEWARERVLEIKPGSNITIWNYAVEERFFAVERTPEEQPSILLACSNIPIKNVARVIDVFSSPKLAHIVLYMAGIEKNAYPDLPNNIIPLGRISREAIVQLMQKVWGLIHLSKADTGPTVVKEARVLGLPVIVTNCCGSKQHVIHGKSGFIVDPNDKESIINHVLQITADKQTSLAMGNYDRKRCRNLLSAETMIEELLRIYNHILQ